MLVIVVLGRMAALDAVAGTAGANKARTVAATLAEKDQERLRSLRTADLNSLRSLMPPSDGHGRRGRLHDRVRRRLVADTTGEDVSCAVATGKGRYLRITSTVTSPMTGGVKPVVNEQHRGAAAGQGHADRARPQRQGRPGQGHAGPGDRGDARRPRDQRAGCAMFGELDAGSYTVRLDQAGWVNLDGLAALQQPARCHAGNLTTVEFEVRQAPAATR